jgi:hypothetical protein
LDRIHHPLLFTALAITVMVLGFWLVDVTFVRTEPTSLPSTDPADVELVVTAFGRDRR